MGKARRNSTKRIRQSWDENQRNKERERKMAKSQKDAMIEMMEQRMLAEIRNLMGPGMVIPPRITRMDTGPEGMMLEVEPPPGVPPGMWDRMTRGFIGKGLGGPLGLGMPELRVNILPDDVTVEKKTSAQMLAEAGQKIEELTEILERVQKEPLILYTIEHMSKDKKHAYVAKQDTEIRIEACKDLKVGDEVLLHPKSMQIVEHLGRPPLEVSRFAPDAIPNVKWEDIGGLEEAKANMIEAIELPHTHKEMFAFYKKRVIKGILLSGPPGCGKTMLGKAAANSLARIYGAENSRTGFLYVKGPEILDQYVGQSEKCIRDIFFDAKRHKELHGYPAIVFLDEADALLAARGSRNIGIGNTIVPTFLAEMDGLEDSSAIVIIATNRPDVLDPAIVRDGRIDRKVTVKRPNEKNGMAILLAALSKVPIAKGEVLQQIATEMAASIYASERMVREGVPLSSIVSGAMLANCVDIATSHAFKRDIADKTQTGITLDDAIAAIDVIQAQGHSVRHEIEFTISINEKGGDHGA